VAISKALAGVGYLKRICKDAFYTAGAIQETHESDMLGGPGADFLREVAFGASIVRFAKMILRNRCSTSSGLAFTFLWQAQYFETGGMEKSQNALVRGRQLCTQLSIFQGNLTELLRS